MGLYTGPPPRPGYSATRALPQPLTYEQQVERHCRREAEREVDCWFLGTRYHWQPFRYREGLMADGRMCWLPTQSGVPPLQFVERR